ncbi:glycine, glutamate and proline-rich protein-like [Branchiostoma floridae x Branchiostoma belcheri]
MTFVTTVKITHLTTCPIAVDPDCEDSQGSNGQYGQCAHVDSCPHGYYITGKCPDYGNDIKCCYNCHLGGCSLSAPTTTSAAPTTTTTTTPSTTTSIDPDCEDSQGSNGQYGQCAHVDSCPHGYYITGKCPDYGNDIKCCYNCHLGGCSLSAPSTTTSTTVTTTAHTTHHHHGDTNGDYGNIMIVDTTGASAETSSQDGLGYSGVAASHQMANTDHSRLNYYRQQIFEAATAKNMDPAIIAAIISRETRAGAALAADGTGDHGNGFGLMQVFCGISGYNAGCGNVQSYAGMDIDTTGDDYANDVVARAQWLKAHGF